VAAAGSGAARGYCRIRSCAWLLHAEALLHAELIRSCPCANQAAVHDRRTRSVLFMLASPGELR